MKIKMLIFTILYSILVIMTSAVGAFAQNPDWAELQERGYFYCDRGDYALAQSYFQDAFVKAKHLYGIKTEEAMMSLAGEAKSYLKLGAYKEAAAASVLVFEISNMVPNFNTQDKADLQALAKNILGQAQYGQGQVELGKKSMLTSITIMEKNKLIYKTKNHRDAYVGALYNLASMMEESDTDGTSSTAVAYLRTKASRLKGE